MMSEDVQSTEFEEMLSDLHDVDAHLYPILSPLGRVNAIEKLRQRSKQEIYDQIAGAQFRGERVQLSWSKEMLMEAYLERYQQRLQQSKERLEKNVCEVLGWDYTTTMER